MSDNDLNDFLIFIYLLTEKKYKPLLLYFISYNKFRNNNLIFY